jgi:type I restriction enzyme S subunit
MTGEWETSRLGDLVAHQKGFAFKSAEYRSSGHPIVRVSNFTDRSIDMAECSYLSPESVAQYEAYKLKHRDAVIATVGSWPTNPASVVGKTICVPEKANDALLNQNAVRLRAKDKLDQQFLFYLLKQPDFQTYIVGTAQGSASQASITLNDIFGFEFQRPPLAEQKAIAAVLGALDEKIELNRQMNATLEAMARALFQSWFVDFDPVRAKLDGRQPVGIDKATADLFPNSFEDSELGHMPKGWRVGSIYEIADVIYGAPFSSKQFNANHDGKPLIRIRDLADETPGVWTPEVHPKGYTVQPGDIVVGMDGEFRAYLWGGNPAWLNQRVCVFAPRVGFSAAFVRNSIIDPLAMVEATETATTVIHLGKNDIDRFKVIIPPQAIHAAFAKLCQPWYDRIVANKQQSRTLATLRDTLLPKLLSGELRVAGVESKLEAA